MTITETFTGPGLRVWLREGLAWRVRRLNRATFFAASFRNGLSLASSYWRKKAADHAICWDGTVITHPPGRAGLCETLLEIWNAQVYTRGFYRPRPGDVVIDGGANIGLFSLWIARAEKRCRVLAFEPFCENYELLRRNLASIGPERVLAINAALGGTSGVAVMHEGSGRSLDHQIEMVPAAHGLPGAPAIPVMTMAEALKRAGTDHIALFKIDIEGSELDLFLTASDDDLQQVDRFAVEYHDNIRSGTKDALVRRLAKTHHAAVKPEGTSGYGTLYATARRLALSASGPIGGNT